MNSHIISGSVKPAMADTVDRVLPQSPGDGPYYHGDHIPPQSVPASNVQEAAYLLLVAAVGAMLNLTVIVSIVACKSLRRMTSAFIMHGCTLDTIKCAYCIPFAISLLKVGIYQTNTMPYSLGHVSRNAWLSTHCRGNV